MRITDRQLRKIIREELIREEQNPGSAFASAASRGDSARRKKIADAMTETYDWFVQNIFPALEYDQWTPSPVADKNYLISPDGRFLNTDVDMGDPGTAGVYIKAGTRFTGPNADYPLSYRNANGNAGALNPRSLEKMYELLEDTADNFNLSVAMQSFPD